MHPKAPCGCTDALLTTDRNASDSGFGSTVTLRQRFEAEYGTAPAQYRRRFAVIRSPIASATRSASSADPVRR